MWPFNRSVKPATYPRLPDWPLKVCPLCGERHEFQDVCAVAKEMKITIFGVECSFHFMKDDQTAYYVDNFPGDGGGFQADVALTELARMRAREGVTA